MYEDRPCEANDYDENGPYGPSHKVHPDTGKNDWAWLFLVGLLVGIVVFAMMFDNGCAKGADLPSWQVDNPANTAAPAQPVYDPYHARSYREFLSWVHRGMRPILYVGVPDASVGTYENHYVVPAGFGGLASGVYDCFFDEATGQAKTTLRVLPVLEVRHPPFARSSGPDPSTTRTTYVTPAVGTSTRLPVGSAEAGIGTTVRAVIRGFINDCPT
jgi:hypothetical protein